VECVASRFEYEWRLAMRVPAENAGCFWLERFICDSPDGIKSPDAVQVIELEDDEILHGSMHKILRRGGVFSATHTHARTHLRYCVTL
jgi:hypothetical protein